MIQWFRRRWSAIVLRSRFEGEMAAEIRSHFDHRIDDLVAGGMSRDDAARRARVEFGALEAYKEQCRDSRGFSWARLTHGLIALVLAPIPLGIAAFVGCRIPARRASRVDPIVALRHL